MIKKKTIDPSLSITGNNIAGRYVVLYEEGLKPQYRSLHYRIVKATGGFGCNPALMGRAVFAEGLDGEQARWDRGDVERFATDQEVEEAKKQLESILSLDSAQL